MGQPTMADRIIDGRKLVTSTERPKIYFSLKLNVVRFNTSDGEGPERPVAQFQGFAIRHRIRADVSGEVMPACAIQAVILQTSKYDH